MFFGATRRTAAVAAAFWGLVIFHATSIVASGLPKADVMRNALPMMVEDSTSVVYPGLTLGEPIRRPRIPELYRDLAPGSTSNGRTNFDRSLSASPRSPLSNPFPGPDDPVCYTVTHPDPTSDEFDMVDWMTMDASIRYSNHLAEDFVGGAGKYSVLWPDKIWQVKTYQGDTWDINLYDDDYIYGWITEAAWYTPMNYRKSRYNTNVWMTPRIAIGGTPGTRIVSCNSQGVDAANCQEVLVDPNIEPAIHEVWGPYSIQLGGDLGTKTIVKIVYLWGCSGYSDDDCSNAEVNWYEQENGWVRHGAYLRNPSTHDFDLTFEVIWNRMLSGNPPADEQAIPPYTTNPWFPCF